MTEHARFTRPRRPAATLACSAFVAASLLLTGCVTIAPEVSAPSESTDPAPETESTPATPPAESPTSPEPTEEPFESIQDFDFENTEWVVYRDAASSSSERLSIVDGTATVDDVEYTVVYRDILFSDANNDGTLDAIVPINMLEAEGAINTQWYLWADQDGQAVQIELPVAQTNDCGTSTSNVTVDSGGFEIHEFRRGIGEEDLDCGTQGSDERLRIVGFTDQGPDGDLWPVQLAPFAAYGGICPPSRESDTTPLSTDAYAVPNSESELVPADGLSTWELDTWDIYSEAVPDWQLVGLRTDAGLGCGWVQR